MTTRRNRAGGPGARISARATLAGLVGAVAGIVAHSISQTGGQALSIVVGGLVGITLVLGAEFYRRSPSAKRNSSARCARRGNVSRSSGDGVNEAAALAGADLGTATGTSTVVAIGAADVTLVRDDIEALARRALATIRGNLLWAFGYNVVITPLAVVGLLNPMLAAGGAAGRSPARRSGVCGPSGSSSALPG